MLAGQPRGLVPASLTRRGCSPNAGSVSKGAAAGEGPGEAGSSQASRGGPRPSCPLPAPEGGDAAHNARSRPPRGSPVAVEALQLALHGAADAAAVAAVQPVAHHAQAVVPPLAVKGKVLHRGGEAPAAPGPGRRGSAGVLPGGGGLSACCPFPHIPEGGPGGTCCGLGEPSPTAPLPSAGRKAAQNSQRDLHPIGGDRGGRAWDPPEVAGRERGRLKHIVGHGAHFFLGWGGAGDTKKDSVRSHCPKYCSRQLNSRTEQSGTGSWGGRCRACAWEPS